MNAIGKIGNFIIIYQEPIQVAAIAMLVIAGMICIGKIIANAVKKRRLLEQINETVSEINDNLKSKSDNRTEVIYIDGRGTPENHTGGPSSTINMQTESKGAQTDSVEQAESEMPEEEKPAAKYFSRDCAVAKDGRKYTIEELDAQIRD